MKLELYMYMFEGDVYPGCYANYTLHKPSDASCVYKTVEIEVPDYPIQDEIDAFCASLRERDKATRINKLEQELAKLRGE